MSLKRRASRALGLCALIFSLTTVGAGSAQAEAGAKWRVAGSEISQVLLPGLTADVKPTGPTGKKHIVVLTKIGGVPIEILCPAAKTVGVHLVWPPKFLGKLKFSSCTVSLGGKESAVCVPNEGFEKGTIETKALKGEILLHTGGVGLVSVEPETGETLASFTLGEECSLPEEIPIIGKIFLKESGGELGTEKIEHDFEEGPLTEMWAISKTAEHKATADAKLTFSLSGAHAGMKWSGLPG